MSTTAYRNTQSSRTFTRQHLRTSSTSTVLPTMTNDRTRHTPQTDHTPSIRESLSTNSISSAKLAPSISLSPSLPLPINSNGVRNSTSKFSKQTYTYSNPPRELQRQSIQTLKSLRHNRLRQRVSSAPDENSFQNSPRSIVTQQKPSSANESSTPRSHDDHHISPLPLNQLLLKRDEQQKSSLNALMREQERSNVPKAVQKRRIILLFRRLPPSTSPLISPRQQQTSSPIKSNNDFQQSEKMIHDDFQPPINQTRSQSIDSSPNDPFYGFNQAQTANSREINAILANIQSLDEWPPNPGSNGSSPRRQQKQFDPKKYEYVAKNSLDAATFKLSPRTLKPDEELAARSRFSQNYRYEMLSSANAQIPPLMASIVAENNNNMSTGNGLEKTFTFRFNSTTTMKKQSSFDEMDSMQSPMDGEQVQLCFDEILKCFYDPNTGTYYELTSA